jgi:hypothetical protein
MDGVDVSKYRVGDVIEVSGRQACLLVVEGWARLEPERHRADCRSPRSHVPTKRRSKRTRHGG